MYACANSKTQYLLFMLLLLLYQRHCIFASLYQNGFVLLPMQLGAVKMLNELILVW